MVNLRYVAPSPPSPYVANKLLQLQEIYRDRDAIEEELPSTRRGRKKRGKRGGVRERVKRRGLKTPLPLVTFGNVQSIRNKTDLLSAKCKFYREYRESAIIALSETWLQEKDADSTVKVDGFSLTRSDRRDLDRERGGGVATYVNNRWCSQVTVKESFCNDDIEYLAISCRPFISHENSPMSSSSTFTFTLNQTMRKPPEFWRIVLRNLRQNIQTV